MVRRFGWRRGVFALLIALAVICSSGALGAALAEPGESLLRVQVSVRPEGLIEPGDVIISFNIENVSEREAGNVYLSSADGLVFELVGQIAPGETRSFSRQHSVTARELEDGEIAYTISYDDPDDPEVKANFGVRAQIRRSDAQPAVEFTRQFSGMRVESGGALTVTYRLRNTGNVALTELQVQDDLGNFTGRVETLDVGESRTLINRALITGDAVSSARLSYRAEGGGEIRTEALADVPVGIASAGLDAAFGADYSAFSRSSANVVLTLTNTGNVGYRDLCIIDDIYGGVIADELSLPAGSDPLEVSRSYAVRGDQGFRWRVTGKSESGAEVDFATDTVALPPREPGTTQALRLNVRALTPRIRRAGNVTFVASIENPGGAELRDLTLSEGALGDLLNFAVIPEDGVIQRRFTLHVSDDTSFNFSVRGADASGAGANAYADPVSVAITADGALPEGEEDRLIEFSGGSIKIGGSSTFAVLLLASGALLLALIVALIIVTHHTRMERKLRAAEERRKRREEQGRTSRLTPVRAPKKNRSKGRNP